MENKPLDLLIGADGINSVVRQGIIDGFQPCRANVPGRSFDILTSNCPNANCNNVIQWSKSYGRGWLYLWGTRHCRQTIMSIDGQPMLHSRFEDICRVGRACRGDNRSHTRSRYCRAPYLRSPAPDRWRRAEDALGDAAHPAVLSLASANTAFETLTN